jgi:hemoglobin
MDQRTLVIAGIVTVATAGVAYYTWYKKQEPNQLRVIYDRIGGEPSIDALVKTFYADYVLKDPVINGFFKNVNMEKQMKMQKAFLNHVFGQKPYNGKGMRAAHKNLKLTDEHFDHVIKALYDAIKSLGVSESDAKAIIGVAETTRNDVLGRY